MQSEFVEGFVLRPMMDAGWTAWLDGRRIGIAEFVNGEIEVEGETALVRGVLVRRLEADLRAAGVPLAPPEQGEAAAA
ncbi:MAG TPA: hypothetical protein VFB25_06495 [Gaiellaceae bacterium]|nr:hypothetical protein [Gaiellaceae bacterium]